MTWLSDPDAWSALAALLALEIVTVSVFEPYYLPEATPRIELG